MAIGDTEQTSTDPVSAGREALARGAWEEARACFEVALEQGATPEILESLGVAAWWLNDATVTFHARERAYRLYRERGDRQGAARVATCLAIDHYTFRGEHAVGNGWVQRAHRLLRGLDQGPEHATLAIWEGHVALMLHNDTATARRLSAQAVTVARSLAVIDLEMLALALEGLALVSQGRIAEGMRLLDEATTAAVAGEMTDVDAIVTACCYLIYACERVRDYDRAAQWCDRVMRISERWLYRLMFSLCRTHYAGVLMWRGAWREAEAELAAATSELVATHPAMAAEGIVRLAELRRRQGRLDEAAALLRQAESHPLRMLGGKLALLGQGALALDQGDARRAADLAERFLRGAGAEDRLDRVAGLELLVRAQVALAEPGQAGPAVAELRSIAVAVATEPLLAAASFAEGLVAAAGDPETARPRFEDAVDLFERGGAPFEAAQARIELARVQCALGRSIAAEREARGALDTFRRVRAAREVDRAATVLREVEAATRGRAVNAPDLAGLTPRELDVLRLLGAGKSNLQIAAELVLSVRTVERHVSTIYEKIGARGKVARSAATAYALSHGLS
jgi:ATP/maltotriose-dependent transcriptional regulator MalT